MTKIHVLYIPGLGDSFDAARRLALSYWKVWGITAELVPMNWKTSETYDEKYQRLVAQARRHEHVIIIGESAGAAMALRVSEDMENIANCITLCGVAKNTAYISTHYDRRAPALRSATRNIPNTYRNTLNIISIFTPLDTTVAPKNTVVAGATKHRLYLPTHMLTIVFGLIAYLPYLLKSKFQLNQSNVGT